MVKKVIIDCDPGIDDALALIYALKSEELDVRAVATVMGNAPLTLTTINTLKVLELIGRVEIPVAKGADKPLMKDYRPSSTIHGVDGLGNTDLPSPKIKVQSIGAVELIISEAERSKRDLTLIQLGPLTNLATAIKKKPEIADLLEEVVIMGGALETPGNITPKAEFNIYVDPDAAKTVFDSGLPITLVPLDVTRKVLVQPKDLAAMKTATNLVAQFVFKAIGYYMESYRRIIGVEGCFLHDPLAVAVAEDRDIVQTGRLNVDVITEDGPDRGRLFSTKMKSSNSTAQKISVCLGVHAKRFLDRFFHRITKFNNQSV